MAPPAERSTTAEYYVQVKNALEDDRLVTKLTIETKEKLGKRPAKDKLAEVEAFVDVRIYPVGQIRSMNYEMLLP